MASLADILADAFNPEEERDLHGRWTAGGGGAPAFKQWFGASKVVDEHGDPLVVYHGTTHEFASFAQKNTDPEAAWGQGFYFGSDPAEVSANYGGVGPDLTGKIARRAEQIMGGDLGGGPDLRYGSAEYEAEYERALVQAQKELTENLGAVVPVYLKMEHPFDVNYRAPEFSVNRLAPRPAIPVKASPTDSWLSYDLPYDEEADEYGEPTGQLVDFIKGIKDAAREYDDADVDSVVDKLQEEGIDGGLSSSRLEQIWRNDEKAGYATDANGKLVSSEIFRRGLEAAGFDGIIDRAVSTKFKNMPEMHEGVVHYIVFAPTQVKSAIGNKGTYDPEVANIRDEAQGHEFRGNQYVTVGGGQYPLPLMGGGLARPVSAVQHAREQRLQYPHTIKLRGGLGGAFEVKVNPREEDLLAFMQRAPGAGEAGMILGRRVGGYVNVLHDQHGNLYVWHEAEAPHAHVAEELGLHPGEHDRDVWRPQAYIPRGQRMGEFTGAFPWREAFKAGLPVVPKPPPSLPKASSSEPPVVAPEISKPARWVTSARERTTSDPDYYDDPDAARGYAAGVVPKGWDIGSADELNEGGIGRRPYDRIKPAIMLLETQGDNEAGEVFVGRRGQWHAEIKEEHGITGKSSEGARITHGGSGEHGRVSYERGFVDLKTHKYYAGPDVGVDAADLHPEQTKRRERLGQFLGGQDEAPGHVFRGNQYTQGSSDLPGDVEWHEEWVREGFGVPVTADPTVATLRSEVKDFGYVFPNMTHRYLAYQGRVWTAPADRILHGNMASALGLRSLWDAKKLKTGFISPLDFDEIEKHPGGLLGWVNERHQSYKGWGSPYYVPAEAPVPRKPAVERRLAARKRSLIAQFHGSDVGECQDRKLQDALDEAMGHAFRGNQYTQGIGGGLVDRPMQSRAVMLPMGGNDQIELLVNPSERDALALANRENIPGVFNSTELRVVSDQHGNHFVWHAYDATHSEVMSSLKRRHGISTVEEETGDQRLWRAEGRRFVAKYSYEDPYPHLKAVAKLARMAKDAYEESKHPREHGRWVEKGWSKQLDRLHDVTEDTLDDAVSWLAAGSFLTRKGRVRATPSAGSHDEVAAAIGTTVPQLLSEGVMRIAASVNLASDRTELNIETQHPPTARQARLLARIAKQFDSIVIERSGPTPKFVTVNAPTPRDLPRMFGEVFLQQDGFVLDAKPRSYDPTRTTRLRRGFRAEGELRLRQIRAQLRRAVVEYNTLGLAGTDAQGFQSPGDRLRTFANWLETAAYASLDARWWVGGWLNQALSTGLKRAKREVGLDDPHLPMAAATTFEGLHANAALEVKGIIAAAIQQVTRQAFASQTAKHTATQAFRLMTKPLDGSIRQRLHAFTHTATVKAHNHAKIEVYRHKGVSHVGIAPELKNANLHRHDHRQLYDQDEEEFEESLVGWLTAGDDRVCQACEEASEDSPYTLDEALALIPMHVNCRCSVYPWEDRRFAGDAEPSSDEPRDEHGRWTASGEKTITAIRRFDELRRQGTGFLAAIRQVKAEHGVNLRRMNFAPYREAMEQRKNQQPVQDSAPFTEQEHPRGHGGKFVEKGGTEATGPQKKYEQARERAAQRLLRYRERQYRAQERRAETSEQQRRRVGAEFARSFAERQRQIEVDPETGYAILKPGEAAAMGAESAQLLGDIDEDFAVNNADDAAYIMDSASNCFNNAENVRVVGDATRRFNCFAWALGDDQRWWDPPSKEGYDYGYHDPWDSYLIGECHGEKTDNEDVEPGYIKIAACTDGGRVTHLARQLPSGIWSSKLGGNGLVIHGLHDLDGGYYGNVGQVYKFKLADWAKISSEHSLKE